MCQGVLMTVAKDMGQRLVKHRCKDDVKDWLPIDSVIPPNPALIFSYMV